PMSSSCARGVARADQRWRGDGPGRRLRTGGGDSRPLCRAEPSRGGNLPSAARSDEGQDVICPGEVARQGCGLCALQVGAEFEPPLRGEDCIECLFLDPEERAERPPGLLLAAERAAERAP